MSLTKKHFLVILFGILLQGCAATGNNFSGIDTPPKDKALVYFYRPYLFFGSGISLRMLDNETEIFTLNPGQYVKYLTTPGKHKFDTYNGGDAKPLDLILDPGGVYFIKPTLETYMFSQAWVLHRVYDNEAIYDLNTCCKDGK